VISVLLDLEFESRSQDASSDVDFKQAVNAPVADQRNKKAPSV
jgi:hypothetical protein